MGDRGVLEQETTLELIDDHILGLDDDDDDDDGLGEELMGALHKRALNQNWKFFVPVIILIVGLLFTFGYFMGILTSEKNNRFVEAQYQSTPQLGNGTLGMTTGLRGSVFTGGERVRVEDELKRLDESVLKEANNEKSTRLELDELKHKYNQMAAQMDTRLAKIKRRESELEERAFKEEKALEKETELVGALEEKVIGMDKEGRDNPTNELRHEIEELKEELTDLRLEEKFHEHSGHPEGGQKDADKMLLDFDVDGFSNEVDRVVKMLEDYWKGPDVLTHTLLLRPGDEIYEAGVEFVAEKISRALVWGDKFVIGAMGSSVTAGHDNCNFDSYERQMERLLKPVFKKAGVDFTVRNGGEGGTCGDSFENQIWCVRHILGDDIDVAHYSWTYFENEPHKVLKSHEMWIRWVLMMNRSPAPQFFNTGGRDDQECANALDSSGHLQRVYGKFGVNIACLQNGITRRGYPGKKWGEIGDGMHKTTRYGETASDSRKKSLGVTFRNWHPGPLGFQVVSDAFAYHYLYALKRALGFIKTHLDEHLFDAAKIRQSDSDTKQKIRELLANRWPKAPKILTINELPPPRYCDEELCNVDEPPGCTNWELPTFGRGQIRILEPEHDMNPFRNRFHAGEAQWRKWTGDKRYLIPRDERAMAKCEHLDVCAGVEGRPKTGLLTLRMPRMTVGRIMVCSPDGKEAGKQLMENLDFWLEDKQFHDVKQVYGKCVLLQERWQGAVHDAKGHIHVGVKVKEGSQQSSRISHVMAL